MKVHDKDLDFLNYLSNEELKGLYEIIVYGNQEDVEKNKKRYNEGISKYLVDEDYKDILGLTIDEFKKYGGNTFSNIIRLNKGVEYKEILLDVCDKFKVKPAKYRTVIEIEQELIESFVRQAINKMSVDELKELVKTADIDINPDLPLSQAITTAFIYKFRAGGFKSYQLTLAVANAILKFLIGRGFTLGGNAMLTKTMSLLVGPIGWVLTGAWTAIDLAGPAYRVTVPAVIEIIMLRNIYECNKIDTK